MSLSDKRTPRDYSDGWLYNEGDVKEAVRKLKASPDFDDEDKAFIDEIFGEDLI